MNRCWRFLELKRKLVLEMERIDAFSVVRGCGIAAAAVVGIVVVVTVEGTAARTVECQVTYTSARILSCRIIMIGSSKRFHCDASGSAVAVTASTDVVVVVVVVRDRVDNVRVVVDVERDGACCGRCRCVCRACRCRGCRCREREYWQRRQACGKIISRHANGDVVQ